MHKPAPSEFPIHELIRERWSPRAFSQKEIPQETLHSLFEAARWAPSSYNEQPWAFIIATHNDHENFSKALEPLVEFNVNWAKHAYLIGFAVAKLAFAKNNSPNRNAHYDTGAAMAYLTMEATSRGLFVHQMAGFDPDTAREVFGSRRVGRPSPRLLSATPAIPPHCRRRTGTAKSLRAPASPCANLS